MLSKITSWRHSKVLAFVLAVAVFLTAFYGLTPVISFAEGEASQGGTAPTKTIWNGEKPTTLAAAFGAQCEEEKIGTEGNPYEITTGAQLYAAVNCTTATYFKLMNDIQLQSEDNMAVLQQLIDGTITTAEASVANLNNWAQTTRTAFKGHLLGNGYTVYGVYGKTALTAGGNGFIAKAGDGASIENLNLEKLYFEAAYNLGGIVGMCQSSSAPTSDLLTISGCSIGNAKLNNTSTTDTRAASGVAGILSGRWSDAASIANCVVKDDVQLVNTFGTKYISAIGPVDGYLSTDGSGSVANCIAAVTYPLNSAVTHTAYSNIYSANNTAITGVTVVTDAAQLKGAEIPGFDATTGWEIKDGEYPKYTGKIGTHPENTTVRWNGYKPTFDVAFGAQAEKGANANTPYEIYYGYQLYAAVTCTDGSYFKLMNDIQLQSDDNMDVIEDLIANGGTDDSLNPWRYTNTSSLLHLDGNNKTISGLYQNTTATGAYGLGLISTAKGGSSVSNLTLDKAYLTGKNKIGGIIGLPYQSNGGFKISGCNVKNSRFHNTSESTDDQYNTIGGITTGHWSGGLVAIENCVVYDTQLISDAGQSNVGGIFGSETWTSGHTIKNCISVGYKPDAAGTYAECDNVYTTVENYDTGVYGALTQTQLKGAELPNINAKTGWEIKQGEYPKYTGETGEHPVDTKVYWNGFIIRDNMNIPAANKTAAINSIISDMEGSGESAQDPKLIYYGYELYAAVNCTTETYFRLMNNFQLQTTENMLDLAKLIDNDDSTNPAEGTTFNDWGKHKVVFKGHIDGNFKTVSGLYINNNVVEGNYGLGFISRAAGPASIDNLTLDQMYATGKVQIGGFVGLMYGSDDELTISGCVLKNSKLHNTSTVEDAPDGKAGDAQYYGVAGIIAGGWNGSQTIKNTAVYDNTFISVRGNYAYGLVGPNNGKTLTATSCIVEGYVPRDSNQAYNNVCTTASVSNSGAAVVTKEQLKSGDILPGIRPLTGWELKAGEYPVYTGVIGTETTNGETYWNGVKTSVLDVFEGSGTGTEDDPYIIRHGFELYAAIQNTDSNKHFKLVNDIHLNDLNLAPSKWTNPWAVWRGEKTFSGTLDGDGHTVYGLYEPSYDGSAVNTFNSKVGVGLIPSADNASIKNLHLRNVNMLNCWNGSQGGKGSGGFVGVAGTVTIDGCSISGDGVVNRHMGNAGGFIGQVTTSATITNSVYISGTVEAKTGYYAGSIIGDAGTATVTLSDVVANGYAFLGNGTATETNTFLVNVPSVGFSPAGVKYVLRSGEKSLSDAFYYDFLSEYLPQLKNRKATQNVDIDGNAGTTLDANDALALKNILLYGGANQVNATDKTNYYNEVEGLDITDLVALYN